MGCVHLAPSIFLCWAQCSGTAVTTEVFQLVLPSGCSLKPSDVHDSLQLFWPTWLTGQYVQMYCLPWLHTVALSGLERLGFYDHSGLVGSWVSKIFMMWFKVGRNNSWQKHIGKTTIFSEGGKMTFCVWYICLLSIYKNSGLCYNCYFIGEKSP